MASQNPKSAQRGTVPEMAEANHLRRLARSRSDLADMVNTTISGLVLLLAFCALGQFLGSALGFLPWLHVPAQFGQSQIGHPQLGQAQLGQVAVADIGPWLQAGFAALVLLLALYLPAHNRVSRLERSHRNFHIGMQDVAHAYRLAHEADRAGAFTLSGEFDTMRERITWLRQHPDLPGLEPELLELAAQMSLQSRDLARIYSDANVARARDTLKARQQETDRLAQQIGLARKTCDEIGHWLSEVEAEERRVTREFQLLERDLAAILPALGYELEEQLPNVAPKRPQSSTKDSSNVVALPKPAELSPRRDRG
ncbi:DNA repair protein [Thioclava sp. GXIMD4216]|uniref:DNA repair protein n=1 Tax=Thioclava sp. GXIMD4216 TaxID=3131929 RepID=UPI0030D2CC96